MPHTDENGPAGGSLVPPVTPTSGNSSASASSSLSREYEAVRAKSARMATEENSRLGSLSSASEKASSTEKDVAPGKCSSTVSLTESWSSSTAQSCWLCIVGKRLCRPSDPKSARYT